MATAGTVRQADAVLADKIVFTSNRTAGVDNPTGEYEIFRMNSDGTGVKQLTFNKGFDFESVLSPDGTKIAYTSRGKQPSNPEGEEDVYVMNASDGKGKKNLSNNKAAYDGFYLPGQS
jgi:Tol biopolymer transport system component